MQWKFWFIKKNSSKPSCIKCMRQVYIDNVVKKAVSKLSQISEWQKWDWASYKIKTNRK